MEETIKKLTPFRLVVGNDEKRYVITVEKLIDKGIENYDDTDIYEREEMKYLFFMTFCFLYHSYEDNKVLYSVHKKISNEYGFSNVGVDSKYAYYLKYIHGFEELFDILEIMNIKDPIINYVGEDNKLHPLYKLFKKKMIKPITCKVCEFEVDVPHLFVGNYSVEINHPCHYWNYFYS